MSLNIMTDVTAVDVAVVVMSVVAIADVIAFRVFVRLMWMVC